MADSTLNVLDRSRGHRWSYRLSVRHPHRRITVIEKVNEVALHQTGRNSGVVHSGIYYKPGSLKAQPCRNGTMALDQFCLRERLPFERSGKVIIVGTDDEVPRLEALYQRALTNGVHCRLVDSTGLQELEPYARGARADHVPETANADFQAIACRLADHVRSSGGSVMAGSEQVLRSEPQRSRVEGETIGCCCVQSLNECVLKLQIRRQSSKLVTTITVVCDRAYAAPFSWH